ncbi:MAG: sigma 54-interacting transcriptional regulator [Proteobacteria bacterium]|jgi:transcriptional regulator with PAS, ATPase and Fis domain|nr:sigma 54-interacting transcriptional regulator [Pseudomonadota bacterium]
MTQQNFRKGMTHIFSYNQLDNELTLTQAQVIQTFPLSRINPVTKSTFTMGKNQDNDIVVFDEYVSGYHCKIEFRDSKFFIKDLGSTNGTFVHGKRVVEAYINDGTPIELGRAKFQFLIHNESQEMLPPPKEDYFCGMISKDKSMKEIFGLIQTLQNNTTPVLIQGETGTGKELIARAIHENSPRKSKRFISVNCGAIAKELIESELFGHEKGAFTGAVASREGLFELADGGTLFLDEIGELPMDLQPKLLRVLENGELRRVGSSKNTTVDVRIIAATHRNLGEQIINQKFREDLYYRIYVLPITLPSLRDRKGDIEHLVEHFLKSAKPITEDALSKLIAHNWPGNVRELKNVIERALVISSSRETIDVQHVQFAQIGTKTMPRTGIITLEEMEKMTIIDALNKNRWKKTETAQKLGIAKSTLHEKVKKYGISEDTDCNVGL